MVGEEIKGLLGGQSLLPTGWYVKRFEEGRGQKNDRTVMGRIMKRFHKQPLKARIHHVEGGQGGTVLKRNYVPLMARLSGDVGVETYVNLRVLEPTVSKCTKPSWQRRVWFVIGIRQMIER